MKVYLVTFKSDNRLIKDYTWVVESEKSAKSFVSDAIGGDQANAYGWRPVPHSHNSDQELILDGGRYIIQKRNVLQ